MSDVKLSVRLTVEKKNKFKDYCETIGSTPSNQLRKYICGIVDGKGHTTNSGIVENMAFMKLYYLIECSDIDMKNKKEILTLLNQVEKNC